VAIDPPSAQNGIFGGLFSSGDDLDGDGYADVVITDYRFSSYTGVLYVYHGSASGISTIPTLTIVGYSAYSGFGHDIASVGDFDGDGYPDIAVTDKNNNVYIFGGSAVGLSSSPLATLEGPGTFVRDGSFWGLGVAGAGDLDGDGRNDVMVSQSADGVVYIFHGGQTGNVTSPDLILPNPEDRLNGRLVIGFNPQARNANPEISIPHLSARCTESIEAPVHITNAADHNIVSAEVFVSYDGDLLTAFSAGFTGTLAESGWSAETHIIEGDGTNVDTIKIAMATDDDVLSDVGTLIYINFQMGDVRTPASSPLILEHVLLNDGDPGNTRTDGSVTLVGIDGAIANNPTEIIPREDITVTVTDIDEDWDNGTQDSFDVRVSNGSQTETLTVLETDVSSGVFEGMISTVFSLGATSGDNIVQAKTGDVIQSCYDDWLDAAGNTVERCDDTNVIGGIDGAIRVTIVSQPGDTVRVRVTDADLNTNPNAPESAQVTATNPTTDESEAIYLYEDGDDSDVFFGLLYTAPGSAAGAPHDATLNTAKGDVLDVTYTDVVTEQGGTEDLTDDDEVVDPFGDADGNGSVQAFDAAKVLLHVLTPYLTGLDSLSANLDLLAFDPVQGAITPYDASLILQKRVGLIDRSGVQEDEADNHPQPETDDSTPKGLLDERLLTLYRHDGYVSVWMDEREEIVSGELVVEGISGQIEMGAEQTGFLSASRVMAEGLRIVFAGASSVEGSGELLRIYSGVGPGNVRLTRARFNDGRIAGRTGETELFDVVPQRFALHPNVPNPFNPETTIRIELPYRTAVRLEIFDVLGQRVRMLVTGELSAGMHRVVWNGRDANGTSVGNGLYLYRLQAGDWRSDASRPAAFQFEQVRRMLLIK
jgi:hypothetical protein